jgi:uncharacterized protein
VKGYVKVLCAVLALLLTCAALAGSAEIPFLSGRVVDNAELLSAAANERVSEMLRAHESRTTDQVVVLTVQSLDGRSIEDYAVAVFES